MKNLKLKFDYVHLTERNVLSTSGKYDLHLIDHVISILNEPSLRVN